MGPIFYLVITLRQQYISNYDVFFCEAGRVVDMNVRCHILFYLCSLLHLLLCILL